MNKPDERQIAGITCGEVLAVLSEFLDGELSPARRQQVEAHLRGCDWCEKFGGRFTEVITALRSELREPEALNADVAARLRARLAKM
jgi:anti-sigma factor RsiW